MPNTDTFQKLSTLLLVLWAIMGEIASYMRKAREGWRNDYEYCGIKLRDDPSDVQLLLAPCCCVHMESQPPGHYFRVIVYLSEVLMGLGQRDRLSPNTMASE